MDTTIGLALSGGGARTAAHIGVLQALNENRIYPTHISGASGGAVIGALFCSGYSPMEILELAKSHSFLQIFKIDLEFRSLTDMSRLKKFMYNHIKTDFADLQLPLFLSLTNLNTGKSEIKSSGDLITFITASCAIPLIFRPVKIKEISYVDGGVLNNLPVEPLLENCDFTIGSNVSGFEYLEKVSGSLLIVQRCLQLAIHTNVEPRTKLCNYAIEVQKAYHYGTFQMKKAEELFEIGYEAAIKEMDKIVAKLNG